MLRTLSRFRWIVATSSAAIGIVLLGLGSQHTAFAHQSPANCNANNLVLNFSKDKTIVRPGDTIHYTVNVTNDPTVPSPTPCDVTNATVTLTLPAMDGTATGTVITLASGASFPANGSGDTTYPVQSYVVNVNSNVTHITATAKIVDELHDANTDNTFSISKDLGDTVTQPHTTLTETAGPTDGRVPLGVTFTYSEKNDGTNAPISGVTVSGDICGSATYQSGDVNTNNILDAGETWVFTCMHTFNAAGTYTDHGTATGTDTVDSLAAPDEHAQASVTVRNPHTTLTESASPASGAPPLSVTFTYMEKNDGTDPISLVTVSGDICGAAAYVSGDANSNNILDVGETWTFTCSHIFNSSGTFTDHGTASGKDTVDNLPAPDEHSQAAVSVSPPPSGPPVGGVTDVETSDVHSANPQLITDNSGATHGFGDALALAGFAVVTVLVVTVRLWYRRSGKTS